MKLEDIQKDLKKISSEYNYAITQNNDYSNLLDSCKLAIMDIIFNEEELIKKLPSKFRQNTRRSYRKDLTSKISKEVDLDNFYTYKNSFVLKNKQNILDPNLAKNNEHLYVSKRLADLYMLPIPVYSMTDILKIHKYLFQDVYSWAGQYRKVNITKSGNPFMSIQSFSSAENFINDFGH